MESGKALIASKTVWGAALVVAGTVARAFGYDIGDTGALAEAVTNLLGAALVLWGRVTAVKKIDRII